MCIPSVARGAVVILVDAAAAMDPSPASVAHERHPIRAGIRLALRCVAFSVGAQLVVGTKLLALLVARPFRFLAAQWHAVTFTVPEHVGGDRRHEQAHGERLHLPETSGTPRVRATTAVLLGEDLAIEAAPAADRGQNFRAASVRKSAQPVGRQPDLARRGAAMADDAAQADPKERQPSVREKMEARKGFWNRRLSEVQAAPGRGASPAPPTPPPPPPTAEQRAAEQRARRGRGRGRRRRLRASTTASHRASAARRR